tara:strand:- start:1688 stop:2659 length:972 start_codon:yes stop_codon:yes gene_type:complete
MKKKIKIICTLGPSSLNKKFLLFSNKNIDLLRLNMSHQSTKKLIENINKIRKFSNTPICIDTEGAQIRTKVKKKKFFKLKQIIHISTEKKDIALYPESVFSQLKTNDILSVGFSNLILKVISKKNTIKCRVISSGLLENNKGVHVVNRKIKLSFLTKKDRDAIYIGKKYNINNYALSFTNSEEDVHNFNKLLQNKNKIYKIETSKAIKNFKSIMKKGENFLIDRGDLSKEVNIENIPVAQRKLFFMKSKFKNKKIFVATNLLESMLNNNYPTRGEANDIFNSLEMGAEGLVLAAETAIGKYPIETVIFLKKMIKSFKKSKNYN